ncbi:MAG: hypothetical protein JXL84_25950 [Deltaproteobacteria bacterium]|nr:hypothetical protein [Deltaproteobacteria bacterium]
MKTCLDEGLIRRAKEYLSDPGISVVKEAATARSFEGVHALHDPTEGGLATGICEMAVASCPESLGRPCGGRSPAQALTSHAFVSSLKA